MAALDSSGFVQDNFYNFFVSANALPSDPMHHNYSFLMSQLPMLDSLTAEQNALAKVEIQRVLHEISYFGRV